MRERVRRFAFFMGGVSLVAGGLIIVACGTDNGGGSTPVPTVPETGAKDTGTGSDGSSTTDGGTDSSSAADCGNAPKLRNNTNGFFCAFYRGDNGDGGTTSNCNNDEICCNTSAKYADGGFAPSFCAPESAPGAKGGIAQCAAEATNEGSLWADGGSAWECNDKNACAAGQICVLITQPGATGIVNIGKSLDKDIPAECNAKQAFKQGGSRCVPTAGHPAADEIKLCSSSDQNCSAGSTCTPFEGFFRDLGYCFP